MTLQIDQQLKQSRREVLRDISRIMMTLFVLLGSQANVAAQSIKCNGYEVIKDSIGKPFVRESFFLREVGMMQNHKDLGLSSDRLLQYPFFLPYVDSVYLFNNYRVGFFAFVDAFSSLKDSFRTRDILFKEGIKLNEKFNLIKPLDTICQSVKPRRKASCKNIKKLFFKYEIYKLKLKVVYIGKYCRKAPYKIVGKNKPMYVDTPLDVYVILDIVY